MRTEIREMSAADIDAAARLLAARHRVDRERTPALSSRFDEPAAVRPQIEAALHQPLAKGVAATRGGELEGFLIGAVALPPPTAFYAGFLPPRSGQISYAGYAATGPERAEVYRTLYAALAPHFLSYGAYGHMIEINAGDETALDAWFSLGFGEVFTLAVRDTTPVEADDAPADAAIEIHQAGIEDIEVVMKLADDLARHHNASPIFMPNLPETVPDFREHVLRLLENPANARWVAYRDGQPLGMQTFHEQDFAEMARPERSVYLFLGVTSPDVRSGGVGTALLHHSMEWARDEGYERCTLHFFTANLSGARFWSRHGFQPLTQRMMRNVDERIAWATGEKQAGSLLPSRDGQREAEGSAAAVARFRPDAAALHLDEAAADGKAEARALCAGAFGCIRAVERLEDAVQVLCRDAAASIEDAHDQLAGALLRLDLDRAAPR